MEQTIVWAILSGFITLGALLVITLIIKSFIRICAPNEALIVSGLGRKRLVEGRERGFQAIIGGRVFPLPIVQQVNRIPLTLLEVPIQVRNAYSSGGIAMNVDAIANVKISSDTRVIGNAVERFLGRDPQEVRRVSKETLEGHLRGVIASLTPEQVNEDRLSFAESLTKESEEDLMKLGLHLDTFKILHVSDDRGYLDSTGRVAIAQIIREAEIAESDAKRAAELIESESRGRSGVAAAEADQKIATLTNELRKIQADLTSEVNSEEEITKAAAREARALAEQKLQGVRAQLEAIRLQTDKVLPAEAERQAAEYQARGDAAAIREKGRAVAEALTTLYQAWEKAGPSAMQISLIEDIEKILAAAGAGVRRVPIDGVSVIDSGDGKSLSNYIGAYPAMIDPIFEALEKTTGIDVRGTVSGRTVTPEEKR